MCMVHSLFADDPDMIVALVTSVVSVALVAVLAVLVKSAEVCNGRRGSGSSSQRDKLVQSGSRSHFGHRGQDLGLGAAPAGGDACDPRRRPGVGFRIGRLRRG